MRAIVTIIDEKTGHVFEKDKLLAPFREQRDPRFCCTEYTFAFRFNVFDSYFRDILDNTSVVDQPPIPYHEEINLNDIMKEEKLRKLKGRLSTAGDRRDWDTCERIEKEIEELEEKGAEFHCWVEESGGHAYNCNDCPNKCDEFNQWDKEMKK